jgi:multidrug resistance efflux pump
MVDTSKYHVRAFVEELDAPRIKIGMPAEISADGLDERLSGRVVRVSPHMTKKQLWSDRPTERFDTKSREVWIELDQSGDHVIGLRMDVTIDIGGTHNWKGEATAEP